MALRALAGGAFFGEASGNSPGRVLALHGWGRRGSDFSTSLTGLDYLAVDLPGFGASPVPREPMGSKEYAAALAPVLDDLADRPLLVGHSFGGRVALMMADQFPERVRGLVLTGVPLLRRTTAPRPPVRYRLARWAHKRGLIGEDSIERLRQKHGSEDYRNAKGVMRQTLVTLVNESYESELSRLRVPLYLLWGEKDTEVPPTVAQHAADLVPDAQLEIVPGIGHFLPTEAPAELRRVVGAMLERP